MEHDATPEKAAAPAPFGTIAANGAVWLGSAQIVRVALTVVSTVVIARILSPDDYGVIAMVGPVLALSAMFQDLGLSTATVQAATLSRAQSNALFWLNMLASALLTLLLLAMSPAVAWFYGDVRAGYVTAVLGMGLIISGLRAQHGALANRDMRFAWLGMIDIAGLLVTYGISIVLAVMLRDYWALVVGTLAGSFVQTLLFWRVSSFRPSWPALRGAGDLARVGGNMTGFSLLNFLVRNLDDVLVARFAGAAAAGLYDRSYRLMMMPLQNINGPLNSLLQPMLVRLHNEPERYRRIFILTLRSMMLAIGPGVAVAAMMSDRLMPWLLGDRWAEAGPIFFWLGLTGLIQPVPNFTGMLFITTGRTRQMLHWALLSGIITVAAFAIGIAGGAVGIAQALFFSLLVRIPLLFAWSTRGTPVRPFDLYAAQLEPLLGPVAVAVLFAHFGDDLPFVPLFIAALAAAYPAALLTSCLTRHGRGYTIDAVRFALVEGARLLGRKRAANG